MLEENEYFNLPDDPEEAFVALHRRKFQVLEKAWHDSEYRGFHLERQYVDILLAFDEVYDLGILKSYRDPPIDDVKFNEFFIDFRRQVEMAVQKILIEAARRVKAGASNIIILDASARTAIHRLVESIREKLNGLDLPESKRESLFNKLNAFAAEVDRNRTRTEAFFAFAIEAARVTKEINDEIKPLQQTIDRVLDFLEKAKRWMDALPPWGERRKIEPPAKRLPRPDEMDDEIPF